MTDDRPVLAKQAQHSVVSALIAASAKLLTLHINDANKLNRRLKKLTKWQTKCATNKRDKIVLKYKIKIKV